MLHFPAYMHQQFSMLHARTCCCCLSLSQGRQPCPSPPPLPTHPCCVAQVEQIQNRLGNLAEEEGGDGDGDEEEEEA